MILRFFVFDLGIRMLRPSPVANILSRLSRQELRLDEKFGVHDTAAVDVH